LTWRGPTRRKMAAATPMARLPRMDARIMRPVVTSTSPTTAAPMPCMAEGVLGGNPPGGGGGGGEGGRNHEEKRGGGRGRRGGAPGGGGGGPPPPPPPPARQSH